MKKLFLLIIILLFPLRLLYAGQEEILKLSPYATCLIRFGKTKTKSIVYKNQAEIFISFEKPTVVFQPRVAVNIETPQAEKTQSISNINLQKEIKQSELALLQTSVSKKQEMPSIEIALLNPGISIEQKSSQAEITSLVKPGITIQRETQLTEVTQLNPSVTQEKEATQVKVTVLTPNVSIQKETPMLEAKLLQPGISVQKETTPAEVAVLKHNIIEEKEAPIGTSKQLHSSVSIQKEIPVGNIQQLQPIISIERQVKAWKIASLSSANENELIQWTISITNNRQENINLISISDTLPSFLQIVESSEKTPTIQKNKDGSVTLDWHLNRILNPGENISISFSTQVCNR